VNEEALAHWGLSRQNQIKQTNKQTNLTMVTFLGLLQDRNLSDNFSLARGFISWILIVMKLKTSISK
jgi:hypothetical protein